MKVNRFHKSSCIDLTVIVELLAFVLDGSGMSADKAVLLQQNMAEAKKRLRAKNQQLKEKDMIIAKLAQRLRNPNAAATVIQFICACAETLTFIIGRRSEGRRGQGQQEDCSKTWREEGRGQEKRTTKNIQ